MNKRQKKGLYESIMKNIAKGVKARLNEADDIDEEVKADDIADEMTTAAEEGIEKADEILDVNKEVPGHEYLVDAVVEEIVELHPDNGKRKIAWKMDEPHKTYETLHDALFGTLRDYDMYKEYADIWYYVSKSSGGAITAQTYCDRRGNRVSRKDAVGKDGKCFLRSIVFYIFTLSARVTPYTEIQKENIDMELIESKHALRYNDADELNEGNVKNTLKAAALATMMFGAPMHSHAEAKADKPSTENVQKTQDKADDNDFEYLVVFKPKGAEKVMFCQDSAVGNEDGINLGQGKKQFTDTMDAVDYLMDHGYKFKCQVGDADKYVLYKVLY